jgi:hypothetical protein
MPGVAAIGVLPRCGVRAGQTRYQSTPRVYYPLHQAELTDRSTSGKDTAPRPRQAKHPGWQRPTMTEVGKDQAVGSADRADSAPALEAQR